MRSSSGRVNPRMRPLRLPLPLTGVILSLSSTESEFDRIDEGSQYSLNRRTGAGALPYDEAVVRLLRCPRCADEMVDHGGELWCLTGGMGLSQTVRAELEDICENDAIPPGQLPEKVSELGGTWYCPADGTLMHFASHALPVCAACDRALTWHVAWQLIERHPHHR